MLRAFKAYPSLASRTLYLDFSPMRMPLAERILCPKRPGRTNKTWVSLKTLKTGGLKKYGFGVEFLLKKTQQGTLEKRQTHVA